MTCICVACQTVEHWRAHRGARQPEACRKCGGRMVRASFSDGAYFPVTARPTAGRAMLTCVLCRRKGMAGARMRVLAAPETFLVWGGTKRRAVVPGEAVCMWHESYEQRDRAGAAGDPYPVRTQDGG